MTLSSDTPRPPLALAVGLLDLRHVVHVRPHVRLGLRHLAHVRVHARRVVLVRDGAAASRRRPFPPALARPHPRRERRPWR
eukprot:53527-Prymnesium_polylepis.1